VAIVLDEPATHCSGIYGQLDVQSKIIAGTPEGIGLAMDVLEPAARMDVEQSLRRSENPGFIFSPGSFWSSPGMGGKCWPGPKV